jgi:CIC family chloride channel protein
MGAVFAGAARAPITAVLIMFELTGEYSIILPLMLAIVVATGVSRTLMPKDTIYTLKLRRRGVDLHRGRPTSGQGVPTATVASVMTPAPQAVAPDLPLEQATRQILASGGSVLPVIKEGGLVGVVTAPMVSRTLADDEESSTLTVAAVTEQPPTVSPQTALPEAARLLASAGTTATPVVDAQGNLAGWLTYQALLAALSAAHPSSPPVSAQTGNAAGPRRWIGRSHDREPATEGARPA